MDINYRVIARHRLDFWAVILSLSALMAFPHMVLAQGTLGANQYAEAVIETSESSSAESTTPSDFKGQLNQRRISSYASLDRALFNRSFDLGYSLGYGSQNGLYSERVTQHGLFLATGLNNRLGIRFSAGEDRTTIFDTSIGKPQTLLKSNSTSYQLGANYLLLAESPKYPQLVMGVSLGQSRVSDKDLQARGLSLSSSRTLESSSLFSSVQIEQQQSLNGDWVLQRALSGAYFVTINHRLAVGLGVSLAKSGDNLVVPSSNASVVYRFLPHWIMKGAVSRVSGLQESTALNMDLIYTYEP